MYLTGQVVARRMTPGAAHHVRHIAELQWCTNIGTLEWSTRAVMVRKVMSSNPGTFFVGGGQRTSLYVVAEGNESWVQTEPDSTKLDNLLSLPIG
jgi:hypothetical protein